MTDRAFWIGLAVITAIFVGLFIVPLSMAGVVSTHSTTYKAIERQINEKLKPVSCWRVEIVAKGGQTCSVIDDGKTIDCSNLYEVDIYQEPGCVSFGGQAG